MTPRGMGDVERLIKHRTFQSICAQAQVSMAQASPYELGLLHAW